MDVKELRVGNFVNPIIGEIGQVTGINNQQVKDGIYESVFVNYQSFLPQHINPIPLTKEWWEKLKVGDIFYKSYCYICWRDGEGCFFEASCCEIDQVKKIDYVHQLQNLCFDFTGKELE